MIVVLCVSASTRLCFLVFSDGGIYRHSRGQEVSILVTQALVISQQADV